MQYDAFSQWYCKQLHLTPQSLFKGRKRAKIDARAVLYGIARDFFKLSQNQIARHAKLNHATINNALKNIEKIPAIKKEIENYLVILKPFTHLKKINLHPAQIRGL